MMTSEQNRFEQLLPFYEAGQLSVEDQSFVKKYLDKHLGAVSSLAFTKLLSAAVKALVPDQPSDAQVNTFLDKWQATQTTQATQAPKMAQPQDVRSWFPSFSYPSFSFGAIALCTGLLWLGYSWQVDRGLSPTLKYERLDGRADLVVVLEDQWHADSKAFLAALGVFEAVILNSVVIDGKRHLRIDCKRRNDAPLLGHNLLQLGATQNFSLLKY